MLILQALSLPTVEEDGLGGPPRKKLWPDFKRPLPAQSVRGPCDLGTQIALWTSLSFSIQEEECTTKHQEPRLALGAFSSRVIDRQGRLSGHVQKSRPQASPRNHALLTCVLQVPETTE